MNDILFLVLRRLRLPLIALIVCYAVAVVGFYGLYLATRAPFSAAPAVAEPA